MPKFGFQISSFAINLMPSPNDIKKGTVINLNGELWIVIDFQRVSPGKGSSFVRTRLRQIKSGKITEQAFKSAETLTFEDVSYRKMQYLYGDQTGYTFMDNSSYEQMTIPMSQIGDDAKFLKEGLEVSIMLHNELPISIELPKKIEYVVASSPLAVKGDTAGGNVTKEVVCDNGLSVAVPIFIKEGDHILVQTETGAYAERVQQ